MVIRLLSDDGDCPVLLTTVMCYSCLVYDFDDLQRVAPSYTRAGRPARSLTCGLTLDSLGGCAS